MRPLAAALLVALLLTAGCADVDPNDASPTGTSTTATPSMSDGDATVASPSATNGSGDARDRTATSSPAADPEPTTSPTDDGRTVTVVRVVDGDTLEVRYPNGTADTVRLLGVDTPEVHAETQPEEWEGVPDSEAGRDCLRAAGHDASDRAKARLEGETVRLEFDDSEGHRGYYGRLLAYVVHDGDDVNYGLVADGLARVYDSSFERADRFYATEDDAQERRLGAWECRDVETATASPTAVGDGGEGSLAVAEVHADAQGNDHENENDEYVVFENRGDESLTISGWTVSDEADHEYTVPDGVTLEPGARVILYTGSGTDTDDELYWGSDAAIWNNSGDTVYVHTDSGEEVVRHEY